ncbi:neuroglobin-like [Mytilus edulis]|uniref:neuroglobin-like n=1 Tax=Mytilus edulis TaxID=6550 RepID=UPI0039F12F7D
MTDGLILMTEDTRIRVKKVWKKFSNKQEDMYELGVAMFEQLFKRKPETKELFSFDENNPDRWRMVKSHIRLLFDMIGEAVGSLDDQASMTPVLENLGNRHFHYGVKQNFYLVFGECLIHAVEEALGDSFTDKDKDAFMTLYHWVGGCIVKGIAMESYK